jgi:glucokinase
MIVGIDVGGTNARALLIDPISGHITDRATGSSAGTGDELVQTLVGLVAQLTSRNEGHVDAVGLGIAGLVSRSGTVRYSPNLPALIEFPIGQALRDHLGVPVAVGNDATTGAWGEARLGAGRDIDDFVFVALGTGIGTGWIVNGQLVLGSNGFAGEAGHMTINSDGHVHLTGQPGPWEYYASGNALGRLGREAAQARPRGHLALTAAAGTGVADISGLDVVEALDAGDEQAAEVFAEFCLEVAIGVANLIAILDPRRVVIGGGLAAIGERLRSGVAAALAPIVTGAEHRPEIEVVLAELGPDAGALGAALMALDAADPTKRTL